MFHQLVISLNFQMAVLNHFLMAFLNQYFLNLIPLFVPFNLKFNLLLLKLGYLILYYFFVLELLNYFFIKTIHDLKFLLILHNLIIILKLQFFHLALVIGWNYFILSLILPLMMKLIVQIPLFVYFLGFVICFLPTSHLHSYHPIIIIFLLITIENLQKFDPFVKIHLALIR